MRVALFEEMAVIELQFITRPTTLQVQEIDPGLVADTVASP